MEEIKRIGLVTPHNFKSYSMSEKRRYLSKYRVEVGLFNEKQERDLINMHALSCAGNVRNLECLATTSPHQ